jgi:hypothetical protein
VQDRVYPAPGRPATGVASLIKPAGMHVASGYMHDLASACIDTAPGRSNTPSTTERVVRVWTGPL